MLYETKKISWKDYAYLIFDGLSFFGFSGFKLNRLKGKAVKWYD
jgi:hypothetical protein